MFNLAKKINWPTRLILYYIINEPKDSFGPLVSLTNYPHTVWRLSLPDTVK